jgi:toxin ParE1/3/4
VRKSKYTIRFLSIAEQDFNEIVEYILTENPFTAITVSEKIEKNLKLLESNPHLGRIPNDEELQRMGYRYIIILDYLIFYKIEQQTILVHRIVHGARNYKPLP